MCRTRKSFYREGRLSFFLCVWGWRYRVTHTHSENKKSRYTYKGKRKNAQQPLLMVSPCYIILLFVCRVSNVYIRDTPTVYIYRKCRHIIAIGVYSCVDIECDRSNICSLNIISSAKMHLIWTHVTYTNMAVVFRCSYIAGCNRGIKQKSRTIELFWERRHWT